MFAEITGGPATSNLNLHGRLTDYEIVGPGETGSMPAEFQIPLDDLFLEHDPAVDRLVLRSHRLGCQVIPVYLGYLVPQVLPAIPRTLILLSPTSMPSINVWGGVPEGPATAGVTVTAAGAVRRSGAEPPQLDRPRRRPTGARRADDHPALVSRLAALAALDTACPTRVFATRVGTGRTAGRRAFEAAVRRLRQLPVADRARCAAHRARPRGSDSRRCCPGADELHVHSERGAHVAELVVETLRFNPHAAGREEQELDQ